MTPSLACHRALPLLTALAFLSGCVSGTAGKAAPGAGRIPSATVGAGAGDDALVRAGNAWKAAEYSVAEELYAAIVEGDPSAPSLAVFRLATLRAWDNELDEAVNLFRRYVAMEPRDTEGRLALGRALAWGGRYSAALAIYDSVIAVDATYRDAVLARAQTLAWAGRLGEALSTYKQWLTAHPTDREASIEYARALSWNGQLDDAESMYAQLARTGNANAKKGLARVISWRGDLPRSERTWRQVLVTDPDDVEALTGLAQVLSWQGRQADAETALHLALRANPAYGDARALMLWVQADLRPRVTVAANSSSDSDDNRATSVLLEYIARARWNGTVGDRYTERWANYGAIDSRADAVTLFGRWRPGTASWQLSADAGVTRHSSALVPTPARQRTIANAALRATGHLARSLTVGIAASRAPFNETAVLIASGVVSSELTGEVELALPARFSLSAGASMARLSGGARENERNAFSSTLRWKHNRRWSVAAGMRRFGYDTTSSDGYFAPKKYTLAEVTGRGHLGGNLGWNVEGDVGVGRQSIELFGSNAGSRLAERIAATAGYRFGPAHEVSASAGYANVAAPGQTGGSEYRSHTYTLRARMGF